MATAYGKVHVVAGVAPPTVTLFDSAGSSIGSGYTNPDFDEASLTIGFTAREQSASNGEIDAIRFYGEYLEATFQIRPKAANIADALESSMLPGAGWSMDISGMKVFRAGAFLDALNTTPVTGNTIANPWFIQPGAAWRGPSTDSATITVTARRYFQIANRTVQTE